MSHCLTERRDVGSERERLTASASQRLCDSVSVTTHRACSLFSYRKDVERSIISKAVVTDCVTEAGGTSKTAYK
ncbi:hypothetical protein Pmani_005491 [Petrolisthes manimaculis]|uniref:Uncharacterized protein n=1 Tax=Petrolisthes manimaculis TaxID=1843537 RepID=A0AAE1UHG1_9EUCA|nr:hypothetical protein Pmani_005491 [Petrolisthes manimaculis]